jgi:hypothetical protein
MVLSIGANIKKSICIIGHTSKDQYVRFLGILVDENISFKCQIDFIKMKICRSLGILRKLKHTFPGSILKILFHCLIQSYVSYCPIVWMPTFPLLLKPLSKVYNKARNLIQETNRSLVIKQFVVTNCK